MSQSRLVRFQVSVATCGSTILESMSKNPPVTERLVSKRSVWETVSSVGRHAQHWLKDLHFYRHQRCPGFPFLETPAGSFFWHLSPRACMKRSIPSLSVNRCLEVFTLQLNHAASPMSVRTAGDYLSTAPLRSRACARAGRGRQFQPWTPTLTLLWMVSRPHGPFHLGFSTLRNKTNQHRAQPYFYLAEGG